MFDYFLVVLAKGITGACRVIPLCVSIFCARCCGAIAFYFFARKRAIASKNVSIAFPGYSRQRIAQIVRRTFMNSAQHAVEIAYLPWLDQNYIDTHIAVKNKEAVLSRITDGKGAIFLGLHEGSWEISCMVLAHIFKEYHFTVLARPQKNIPRLNQLLDNYRLKHHCGIIRVDDSFRPLIEHLKKGYALGMVADHGAQGGIFVDFFKRPALTPTGAVRLALKLDAHLIVGFLKRNGNKGHTLSFHPFDVAKTGNFDHDIKSNLENINRIYEEYIRRDPEEYLWFFKRWKHSPQRSVLVLSDGKAGHFKQSLAVVEAMRGLPFAIEQAVVEIKFKNRLQRMALEACCFLFGLRGEPLVRFLLARQCSSDAMQELFLRAYDAVVSCGSSLAFANRFFSKYHQAKSIAVMKPGIADMRAFDLLIVAEHDCLPLHKNMVAIKGALSGRPEKPSAAAQKVIEGYGLNVGSLPRPVIGLVVGGDNKYLALDTDLLTPIVRGLKQFAQEKAATIIATSSRRTSAAVEALLRQELKDFSQCTMLIIANEHNPDGAIEALFEACDMLVISGESISMISEALAYGKYVFVFPLRRKKSGSACKHERFVEQLERDGAVYRCDGGGLRDALSTVWAKRPAVKVPADRDIVRQALKKIL